MGSPDRMPDSVPFRSLFRRAFGPRVRRAGNTMLNGHFCSPILILKFAIQRIFRGPQGARGDSDSRVFLGFSRNGRSPMVPTDRSSGRGQKGLRFGGLALAAPAAAFVAATPAQAAFHFMVIQEVFVGPPSDGILRPVPLTADQKAQYVMLRMTSNGQNFVNGTSIRVEDANGNILGTFGTFTANPAN